MPQLHVPARLEQLAAVNSFLSENIPPRFLPALLNVELVTEELLVNVFSYAYPEGTTGNAEIALREVFFDGEDMLCFSVKDWGAQLLCPCREGCIAQIVERLDQLY